MVRSKSYIYDNSCIFFTHIICRYKKIHVPLRRKNNSPNYSIMKKICKVFITCACLTITHVFVNAQEQLTPECSVEIKPNQYIIHFKLPEYWFEKNDEYVLDEHEYGEPDNCGIFLDIDMDADFDVTDIPSYPEIPFFSLNLLLPSNASNLSGYIQNIKTEDVYINEKITPAILGNYIENINGSNVYIPIDKNEDPCVFQSDYYANGYDSIYPTGFYRDFYRYSSPIDYIGTTGFSFSIFPFSYAPNKNYIKVLRECTFVINFSGDDLLQAIDELSNSTKYSSYIAMQMYDNFNSSHIDSEHFDSPIYLIVASHSTMETTLQPYVDYKTKQGYNVIVEYLDNYGITTPKDIKKLIRNNPSIPFADYVLLVGSLSDIPASSGSNSYKDPYTDDYYHPFLGRWIVSENDEQNLELKYLIQKTMGSELQNATVQQNSSAALFSGVDKSRCGSRRFYKRIKRIYNVCFKELNINTTLYDGRDTNVDFTAMNQAILQSPTFFIYGGHGTIYIDMTNGNIVGSAISNPYNLTPYNMHTLGNGTPYPMGFGFACSLNTFATENSFAHAWTTNPSGGVCCYGSSTESGSSSNNYLSKWTFRTLRDLTLQTKNIPLGVWLNVAEYRYYSALLTTSRCNQVLRYGLIGDPTMYIYGMSADGSVAPFHIAQRYGTETLSTSTNDSHNLDRIEVYDICGHRIAIVNNTDNTDMTPNGTLRIIKKIYTNGECETIKLF